MSSSPSAISSNALAALTSPSSPIANLPSQIPQSTLASATPSDIASLSSAAQQQLETEYLFGGSNDPSLTNPSLTDPANSSSLFSYIYSPGYTSAGTFPPSTDTPIDPYSLIDPTAEAQLLAQSALGSFSTTGSQLNVTG